MSENTEKKSDEKKGKRSKLIEELRKDGLKFGINSLLEPTVHIPGNPFQTDWPADSQRVSDLLYGVYYEQNEAILPPAEREFLLSQIREECRVGGQWFGETEAQQTEKDVIVQAVLYLVNDMAVFDDQTCVLLAKLRMIQSKGKIAQYEEIPAFTNIFSRRLRRLIPVLKGYGVEATLRHEEDGSYCRLVRRVSFQKEPDSGTTLAKAADDESRQSSAASSSVITKSGKDFVKTDGADGESRFDDPKERDILKARRAELAAGAAPNGQSSHTTTLEKRGAE